MNYVKAQKEIFNALCKGGKLFQFRVDKNTVFVSPNGYFGYIFPVSTILFNIDKIREVQSLKYNNVVSYSNKLELTDNARIIYRGTKKIYRQLQGKNKTVYVEENSLSCFQNPSFYQAANENSLIVVTENLSEKLRNIPVGILMPFRFGEV